MRQVDTPHLELEQKGLSTAVLRLKPVFSALTQPRVSNYAVLFLTFRPGLPTSTGSIQTGHLPRWGWLYPVGNTLTGILKIKKRTNENPTSKLQGLTYLGNKESPSLLCPFIACLGFTDLMLQLWKWRSITSSFILEVQVWVLQAPWNNV